MKVYQMLAIKVEHLKNLLKVEPTERDKRYISKVQDEIYEIISKHLPSGSGIDNGIKLVLEEEYEFSRISTGIQNDGKIILTSSFHVLDENGSYDGWIKFIVEIIPSLAHSFRLKIKGRFSNRVYNVKKDASDIKEYLYDLFNEALSKEIPDIDDVHVCEQLDTIAGETITTYTVVDGIITLILANGKTVSFSGLKEVNWMKLYPGVYYFTDESGEMIICKLDYDGTWYVLDASNGAWNTMKGATPYCGFENLKKY